MNGGITMSNMIKVTLPDGTKECEKGTTVAQVLGTGKNIGDPLIVTMNGVETELSRKIYSDCSIIPYNISSPFGARTYMRSVVFLLIRAVRDVFPAARVTIEHSLGKGLYGEIHMDRKLTKEDIDSIKQRMHQIVDEDEPISPMRMKKEEAEEIFRAAGMDNKVRILKYMDAEHVNVYKCGDMYDYFYGLMVPSMGYLKLFDIMIYEPGFILRYPRRTSPLSIPEFTDSPKIAKIFKETEDWARILDVLDVGALNEKVESGEIRDFILVAEGLHEKKIAAIADKIYENKDKIKIVLIAGPSSSGKTTFSRRLAIQLRVLGLRPYAISLDDYFIERDKTPRDENGNPDFESINALDVNLFNEHLTSLMDGKEIEFPRYNFKTGKRERSNKRFKMDEKSVLVIEGIHGLNELLTSSIPRENKYKIYISALTQLNIDDHNRIPTTDVRVIRRIVRDNMSRGRSAETTLMTWQSVREGEDKNIFPYQEEADIMFNSTLDYEMCILKRHSKRLLDNIKSDSPVYLEAKRLRAFLSFFKETKEDIVPKNSIIREFIGGSCFEDV